MLKANVLKLSVLLAAQKYELTHEKFAVFCEVCINLMKEGRISAINTIAGPTSSMNTTTASIWYRGLTRTCRLPDRPDPKPGIVPNTKLEKWAWRSRSNWIEINVIPTFEFPNEHSFTTPRYNRFHWTTGEDATVLHGSHFWRIVVDDEDAETPYPKDNQIGERIFNEVGDLLHLWSNSDCGGYWGAICPVPTRLVWWTPPNWPNFWPFQRTFKQIQLLVTFGNSTLRLPLWACVDAFAMLVWQLKTTNNSTRSRLAIY